MSTLKVVKLLYKLIFIEQWSPFIGAAGLVALFVVLMASGMSRGIFGGIKLWGAHLNQAIGSGLVPGIRQEPNDIFMRRSKE